MAALWYYKLTGQTYGPFTANQLRDKAIAGEITSDASVRKGSEGKWAKADRVSGLFNTVRPQSPGTGNPITKKAQKSSGLVTLDCTNCGARLEIDEESSTYTCKYCRAVHERDYSNGAAPTPHSLRIMAERAIAREEYGKAMQFIEQGLAIDPHDGELLALELNTREMLATLSESLLSETDDEVNHIVKRGEAEQYESEAQFILHELQANNEVYGSNSSFSGATPADVDLGLQYIDRSLELFPDEPNYLNLKALLLWEGNVNKDFAIALIEKAAALDPRDINIQNNLKNMKSSPSCFIATAAYGTPLAAEIDILRNWRDQHLLKVFWGKSLVAVYYILSPTIAKFISKHSKLKKITRCLLAPLIWMLTTNCSEADAKLPTSQLSQKTHGK